MTRTTDFRSCMLKVKVLITPKIKTLLFLLGFDHLYYIMYIHMVYRAISITIFGLKKFYLQARYQLKNIK